MGTSADCDDDQSPGWLRWAPLLGAVVLAVPVAAQRDWEAGALALVALILAVSLLDFVQRVPPWVGSVVVIAAVCGLFRWHKHDDIAPFYFVALNALSAATWPLRRSAIQCAATVAVFAVASGWLPEEPGGVVVWSLGIVLGWVGGAGIHEQTRLTNELQAAQGGLAERAAADERQRIAREIHDVIAHSLTVTMLHLTGARLALESGDRDEAVDALTEAERLGRQSLGDIRRTVGLLGTAAATAAPMPSAADIPGLVAGYRDAGMPVELSVDGPLGDLSLATGLGLYRIVQEALANVGRHAAGAAAVVDVEVGARDVRVRVTNEPVAVPVGAPSRQGPGGMGLDGMRERATLLGGELLAGPMSGGGWEVVVTVPREAA